jgi:glycosyltransferase involved in cell wall biosynthesis
MQKHSYVLVTAAYNEEAFIEEVIRSLVAQDAPPKRWIIVSDGSTDKTDEIVNRYAAQYKFIQLHRITEDHARNFTAQVNAINAGFQQLKDEEWDYIGNMDADVTMEPNYFSQLLGKFEENARLGLGGGSIHERNADLTFQSRKTNSVTSVAHAAQIFRKECFEAVGGSYLALPYGGPDTYAETTARMKGWHVESFPELPVFHHRPTGAAGGLLRSWYRQGKMDYSLGALPMFEVFKIAKRLSSKPFLVGAMARMAGFLHSYYSREKRAVSSEFMTYLRQEHRQRISSMFRVT